MRATAQMDNSSAVAEMDNSSAVAEKAAARTREERLPAAEGETIMTGVYYVRWWARAEGRRAGGTLREEDRAHRVAYFPCQAAAHAAARARLAACGEPLAYEVLPHIPRWREGLRYPWAAGYPAPEYGEVD